MTFHPGDHVVDSIDDALHGLLPAADEHYVKAHCETCPICATAMTLARQRWQALQGLAAVEVSAALVNRTVQGVAGAAATEKRHRSRYWRIAGPAIAAAVLILASLHVYYATLTPSAFDLKVLGQSQLLANTDASLRVQLLRSGAPERDARVTISMEDPKGGRSVELVSFRTDGQGTGQPRFHLPDWPDGSYTLRVTTRSGWDTQTVEESIALKRSWQLMLSTDKPVYQPGQTLHLRGLALRRPDLKPVAGQDAVFSITDPNSNVIFKQTGVTSRFGISAVDCPLATEIIEGAYTVTCRLGDTDSSTTVEVKPYVLPKFRVGITLDQPFYQPGQPLRATVQADYFFGRHVADATVELEGVTTDVTKTVLIHQTAETNSAGTVSFALVLPTSLIGTEQNSGDARIQFTAKVRDTGGQEESRTVTAVVTSRPIHIELIPEAGRLVRGLPNRLYVLTTYADGRPAQTRLSISNISSPPTTSPLGAAVFELTPATDELSITVEALDHQGLRSTHTFNLRCGAEVDGFLVRTDRAVYRGGQTLALQALGGGVEPVFIDLIKDGQTLLTRTLEMTGGSGQLQIDLAPEVSGTLQVVAYRFSSDGLPIRKTRVVYVEPPNGLIVHSALDRSEYRPGTPAKITFQVTDVGGKPVPGALSLAAVDESVFSVLTQAPGLEKTFFTLEQKLLQPVYAIYPWSPDFDAPETDRQVLEQAIFANAADEPTDRDAFLQRLVTEGRISPALLEDIETPAGRAALRDQAQYLPPAQQAILLTSGVHSLVRSTGPENAERVERLQRDRLEIFPGLWILTVMGSIIAVAFGWSGVPGLIRALVVILLLACVVGMLIPALGSASRAARRVRTASEAMAVVRALEDKNLQDGPPVSDNASSPRVRERFPETLLWRPELITDDQGRATLDVDLADSITTWRLSASAVSASGQLGASATPIRVFQPFFVDIDVPVCLTRNDEIALPVVVYNYLDQPQKVSLAVDLPGNAESAWFELLDPRARQIQLKPNEVRSVNFRIRATRVGHHEFQVTARAGAVGDAVRRSVEVVSDGRLVEKTVSGTLSNGADLTLSLPAEAIAGSSRATLKLYPSVFSQLVEGLDAIFQQPYGCFEQTSSTTYPNVLALDYLHRTGKAMPEVEATARQYIHLGYQRLVSFEVSGGGFDWFGRPPANRTLTAYGLLEFEDMAKVHNVDPNLISRTRKWLLSNRNADGSWSSEGHMLHEDPTTNGAGSALGTTAYIAWAVFQDGNASDAAPRTRSWLLQHVAEANSDPYTLALVANALLAIDANDSNARDLCRTLVSIKQSASDLKTCWWSAPGRLHTAFYGAGTGAQVETTALVALALLRSSQELPTAHAALNWLIAQKDSRGTWHSTQATVLALKALLAATGKPLGGEKPRELRLQFAEGNFQTVTIPTDQADVMQQLDLTSHLTSGNALAHLSDQTNAGTAYQLTVRYYVPMAEQAPVDSQPLSIRMDYDRSTLTVGQILTATATVQNNGPQAAPMVILDLPIPAGFALHSADLDALRTAGRIAKYQLTGRSAIVYLRDLAPGKPLKITYGLTATMPVNVSAPPGVVYEYYNPENRAQSSDHRLRADPT